MAVPDFQSIMRPFLEVASDGNEHRIASMATDLAQVLTLTEGDIDEMLPSGRQTRFRNRVNWVATYFCRRGFELDWLAEMET